MSKKRYFLIISLLLTASYFLPLVFDNLPAFIGSHVPWAILWFGSLIIFYPRVFSSKLMILIILYSLFLFIGLASFWRDMDDWNRRFLLTELYHLSVGAAVISYYFVSKDFISLSKLSKWAIIFIAITAIMSIFSSTIDPEYARNIVGSGSISNESKLEEVMSMKRYGGGGYGAAIAFMSILPILVYYYRFYYPQKKFLLYILLLILALFSMQIFGNIIIGLFMVLLAFLGLNKFRRTIIISLFIIGIMYSIPKQIYIRTLYGIANEFNKYEELKYKFTDLALFLDTGADIEDPTTGTGGRAQRYPELINTFSESPIMGCYFFDKDGNGYNPLGAHLYWMNKLTVTGLVGFVFFLSIIVVFIRTVVSKIDKGVVFYYLLATFSLLCYGLFKNISTKGAWYAFFVIIPALLYFPVFINKKKE